MRRTAGQVLGGVKAMRVKKPRKRAQNRSFIFSPVLRSRKNYDNFLLLHLRFERGCPDGTRQRVATQFAIPQLCCPARNATSKSGGKSEGTSFCLNEK